MKTITIAEAGKWNDREWFLWTHIGEGRFYRYREYNKNSGWVNVDNENDNPFGFRSFMVCPSEKLYSFDSLKERVEITEAFQKHLRDMREELSKY